MLLCEYTVTLDSKVASDMADLLEIICTWAYLSLHSERVVGSSQMHSNASVEQEGLSHLLFALKG